MISSAANMKFWLYLCQASNLPDAITAIKPFSDAAADGKLSLAGHCQEYNAALMHKVTIVLKYNLKLWQLTKSVTDL